MVKLLAERACAKINLFLRVTGRRADGYHELDSIFVPVSLSDQITIEVRPAPTSSIALQCNLAALADPQINLAARAARAFTAEFGTSAQIRIDLEKKIPAGAGLGGGSSDAGAVLRMLAAMTASMLGEVGNRTERLRKIALSLGADVPFFLDPRSARVRGIGEQIEAIEGMAPLHLVIAIPAVEVPTAAVFKAIKPAGWSGAAPARDVAAIMRGEISMWHLVNDLEGPAVEQYPQIGKLKVLLQQCGASAASMSGSGGAVFGIFGDDTASEKAAAALREKAPQARVFVVKSLAEQPRGQD